MPSELDMIQIDYVVQEWLEYHRIHEAANDLEHNKDLGKEKFWALEVLFNASRNNPEFCWKVILQLIDHAQTESQLANIAAGPLEDLLVSHGNEYISLIEERAKNDSRFREVLSGVWKNMISADIWERIKLILTK